MAVAECGIQYVAASCEKRHTLVCLGLAGFPPSHVHLTLPIALMLKRLGDSGSASTTTVLLSTPQPDRSLARSSSVTWTMHGTGTLQCVQFTHR